MRKKGSILIAMGLLLIAAALSLTIYNIWDADRADQAAQSTVQSLRELIPQNGMAQAAHGEETVPGQTAASGRETEPVNVTLPGMQTAPVSESTPGEADAPAEAATSGEATEPLAVTTPVGVTAPAEAAAPAGVRTREVKIKPGAQTAPDLKKGILAANLLAAREMPTVTLGGYRYIGMLDVQSLDLSLPVMEEWDYDRLRVSPCRFAGNVYEDNLVICAHNYPQHFTPLKYAPLGTEVKFTDAEGNEFLYAVSSVETIGPNDVEGMIHGDWDLTLFTCNTNGQTRCAIRCDRIN